MKTRIILLFIIAATRLASQDLYFPPSFSSDWATTSHAELDWCSEQVEEVDLFLEESNTLGFIILKDGQIAMESYFGDHDVDAQWYWASAGKSMVSVLTGITQQEGLLDINQPSSTYLGAGWSDCPETESAITVKNHLTLTTGLDYTVPDENCLEPDCFTCLNLPGEEWYYHNSTYRIIADMLTSVSGQSLTQLTNDRVANKIGYFGAWLTTDESTLYFSTARGMARFGLLMLARGEWDGDVVIEDDSYFNAMTTPSQDINESYGYLWWLNAGGSFRLPGTTITFFEKLVPNAPDDLYAAIGKNGQMCIVVPSENLVIVRMGNNPDESQVPIEYVRDIWAQYESLSCTSATDEMQISRFELTPRLTDQYINIDVDREYDRLQIIDRSGNVLMEVVETDHLDVGMLKTGIYFARIISGDSVLTRRFVKI